MDCFKVVKGVFSFIHGEFSMPENNAKHVIEIVCYSASKLTDHFHFLGLDKRFLNTLF